MDAPWLTLLFVCAPGEEPSTAGLTHGPFLGHVSEHEAHVWARAVDPGPYRLTVSPTDEDERHVDAVASREHDLCLKWRVTDLDADAGYRFTVTADGDPLASGTLWTAPPPERPAAISLAFASCVDERRFPDQPGWDVMAERGADAVVLLGDTPYIDSTELEVQRRRYREFYSIEPLARLLRGTSLYATWDDHDFGRNDTDGLLAGRERSRQAFVEYHAGPQFGDGEEGIYSSFRRGPVEVFLIDARWFANVETSPVDEDAPSLLGATQWRWLTTRIASSTATFKLLCTGMIWNDATRPLKTDHWGTYHVERDALFRFLGDEEISGVVLIAGDIHRSRVIEHATTESAGYRLTELITSPLANRVIELANAPHPGLRWDAGVPDTFLMIDADSTVGPPTLTARFLDSAGEELHVVHLDAASLRFKDG